MALEYLTYEEISDEAYQMEHLEIISNYKPITVRTVQMALKILALCFNAKSLTLNGL